MRLLPMPLFLRACFAGLLLVAQVAPAGAAELELGTLYGVSRPGLRRTKNEWYLIAKAQLPLLGEAAEGATPPIALRFAARAVTREPKDELDLRELVVAWTADQFKLTAGFQEIPWGETFGFFIADLVNPRDYRDPLFNEMSWVRLPVASVNAQAFFGNWTLQGVVTPFPRKNRYPALPSGQTGGLEPGGGRELELSDTEFGGRISALFDSGLDLGAIYFRHLNRNPVYQLEVTENSLAPELSLEPVLEPVDTVGLTASQAWESWVFRGDALLHLDEPQQDSSGGAPVHLDHFQMILGADVTPFENVNWGGQFHLEAVGSQAPVTWFSLRGSRSWFGEKLELTSFLFMGIGNRDLWLQPALTYHFTSALSLMLRVDRIWAGSSPEDRGILSPLRNESRFLAWMTYRI